MEPNIPPSPIEQGYLDPAAYPLTRDLILIFYKILNIIPFSYHDENHGKLFRSIVPVRNEENMIGSYGSKNEFKFHSDNPTYKIFPEYKHDSLNSPEFLSLYCMRGQNGVHTSIVDLDEILKYLDNNTISILQENIYVVNTPDSFDRHHEVVGVSVVSRYKNKFYTRFDYHNIKGINDRAKQALRKFIDVIENIEPIRHVFKSGDFLIFKNQQVLHSRDSFESPFDGKDRWLLRVYGASSFGYLNHCEINKEEIKCI